MSNQSNTVEIVVTASDRASQVLLLVQRSLTFITSAVGDVTKAYITYGDQVATLSRFVGINSEASSRLIAVADDNFVAFDTLRLAAKNLSEKGIQPNIENIGKLSDQYLKLEPGLARSQFLIDNFGRSGIEMAKIMELGSQKLSDMSAKIESGLVIDDAKAERIKKMKDAQMAFNDALESVKFEWADRLLQAFQALPKPMQDVVLTLGMVGQSGLLGSMSQLAILVSTISKGGGAAAAIQGVGAASTAAAPGIWAAVAPVAALAGALMLLAYVWDKYGGGVMNSLKQASVVIAKGMGASNEDLQKYMQDNNLIGGGGQSASGGMPTTDWSNYQAPNTQGVGKPWGGAALSPTGYVTPRGGGAGPTLIYSPQISLATEAEARSVLWPMLQKLMNSNTGTLRG